MFEPLHSLYGLCGPRCWMSEKLNHSLLFMVVILIILEHHMIENLQAYNAICELTSSVNTLRPRQNGRQIPDDNFNCICMNENI